MRRLAAALCLAGAVAAAAGKSPPSVGSAAPFAADVNGPEGIATTADGAVIVGRVTGEVRRYAPGGGFTVLADVGERLAGIAPTRRRTVLACAFEANRVWEIDLRRGAATIVASDVDGANAAVEARNGRRYVSASRAGTIVDVSGGTPVPLANGLLFPNGLAIGRDRFLYVAETVGSRVARLPIRRDGSLGAAETYVSGVPLADGLAFDRDGNLLVLASDHLYLVLAKTGTVLPAFDDPLFDFPASLAFGRGHGLRKRDLFVTNFGASFGNGTTVVRVPYGRPGAPVVR